MQTSKRSSIHAALSDFPQSRQTGDSDRMIDRYGKNDASSERLRERHFARGGRLRASPRLFENPLLDKLSRVHWSTPFFFMCRWLSGSRSSVSNPSICAAVLAATGLGYFIWTLIEYFGHRFLFHYEFPGRFGARIHFLIHGVHHVHPNDPLRLVMPALLSGPIMLIAYAVVRLLFGLPLGYPVLMGFITRLSFLRHGALLRASCRAQDTPRADLAAAPYAASFPRSDARLRGQRAVVGLCVQDGICPRRALSPPALECDPFRLNRTTLESL